ncbi:MAG: histidine phosphatase family protein [Clostridia bacterium]|nr:histidine phosphatase family protein [Clostridia bacterium]
MRLFIIRHGDTHHNRDEVFRGRADIHLDDSGEAQAAATGRALSGSGLCAVYASPLSRTVETARAIAAPHGLPVETVDGLNDIDVGLWEGLPVKRVRSEYGIEFVAWQTGPELFRFPGGESLSDVSRRSTDALSSIISSHGQGDSIAIVSHRVVAKLLLLHMVGAPVSSFWNISQDPCCINLIQCTDLGYILHKVNDTSHLASL